MNVFYYPINENDTLCRQYKECLACSILVYGEECSDFTDFRMEEQVCLEFADSCQRAMCECYKRFYNYILISTKVIDKNQCSKDENMHSITCCTDIDRTSPFILYNSYHEECQLDGTVKKLTDDLWSKSYEVIN